MIPILIHKPEHRPAPVRRLRPGAGLRMTSNAMGECISALSAGANFNHPWRPFLSGTRVTLLPGTVRSVNGIGPITPTILSGGQQVPMNGPKGNSVVPLVLVPGMQNSDGECWVVLEVTPDPTTGELLKGALCQIRQFVPPAAGNFNDGTTKTIGRTPLAQFVWRGTSVSLAQEIAMFNFLYQRIVPGPGGGKVAHFFL